MNMHSMPLIRLLLVLAVVDSIHLVSSFFSFSLPRLSLQFCMTTYHHIIPITLPLAQVSWKGDSAKVSAFKKEITITCFPFFCPDL